MESLPPLWKRRVDLQRLRRQRSRRPPSTSVPERSSGFARRHGHAAGLAGGTVWIVGELDPQTKRLPAWTRGAQAELAVIGADNTQVASQRFELKPGEGAFHAAGS